MPTYEYACKSCGQHTEAVQAFTDPPLTECPACGGVLRKVFGNVGISFKGAGFYKTDSRGSGAAKPGEKTDAGADGAKSGEKVDSTSASAKAEGGSSDTGGTKDTASKTDGSSGTKTPGSGKKTKEKSSSSSGSASSKTKTA